MDWDKAKSFAIFLFFVLNVVLLALNITNGKKYSLTENRQSAIADLLSQSDIQLEADMPKEFEPRQKLLITKTSFDYAHLTNVFFQDPGSVNRTIVNNRTVFKDETSALYINADGIVFENFAATPLADDLHETLAKNMADSFIQKINLGFKQLTLDSISFDENYFYLKYYERYDKDLLFFNSIDVVVSKYGIRKISVSRYLTENFTGQKRDIYAPDEALFSTLRYLRDNNIVVSRVWKIDLGYALSDEINDLSRNAEPSYLIYADAYTVLVNAFTNDVMLK